MYTLLLYTYLLTMCLYCILYTYLPSAQAVGINTLGTLWRMLLVYILLLHRLRAGCVAVEQVVVIFG